MALTKAQPTLWEQVAFWLVVPWVSVWMELEGRREQRIRLSRRWIVRLVRGDAKE